MIARSHDDGLTMQTVSKILVFTVLACLLLPWAGGRTRAQHTARAGHHLGRERPLPAAHLRRWREVQPDHHPLRKGLAVALTPEEDDDDEGEQSRQFWFDGHEGLSAVLDEQATHPFPGVCRSRRLPTDVSLHQTLCILLI